jgi:hypothetical protein
VVSASAATATPVIAFTWDFMVRTTVFLSSM